jgi:hypothetical protein
MPIPETDKRINTQSGTEGRTPKKAKPTVSGPDKRENNENPYEGLLLSIDLSPCSNGNCP